MSAVSFDSEMIQGSIFQHRWRVQHKLGAGSFGAVYSAFDLKLNERVAIKLESVDSKRRVLKVECALMRDLRRCPYVAKYISYGKTPQLGFLVMELLGDSLYSLRRRMPSQAFSLATVASFGGQMIRAIQALHDAGWLHRDVKPSNFVMGFAQQGHIYIIDFGLSKRYVDDNGVIMPPRSNAGFRGTSRYASIHSHHRQELSRRDDIWSLLYCLIEMAGVALPWRFLTDRSTIGLMKQRFLGPELVQHFPAEFGRFLTSVKSLNFYGRPNYEYLTSLLRAVVLRCVAHEDVGRQLQVPSMDERSGKNPEDEVARIPDTIMITEEKSVTIPSSSMSLPPFVTSSMGQGVVHVSVEKLRHTELIPVRKSSQQALIPEEGIVAETSDDPNTSRRERRRTGKEEPRLTVEGAEASILDKLVVEVPQVSHSVDPFSRPDEHVCDDEVELDDIVRVSDSVAKDSVEVVDDSERIPQQVLVVPATSTQSSQRSSKSMSRTHRVMPAHTLEQSSRLARLQQIEVPTTSAAQQKHPILPVEHFTSDLIYQYDSTSPKPLCGCVLV